MLAVAVAAVAAALAVAVAVAPVLVLTLVLALALAPTAAEACPVCFLAALWGSKPSYHTAGEPSVLVRWCDLGVAGSEEGEAICVYMWMDVRGGGDVAPVLSTALGVELELEVEAAVAVDVEVDVAVLDEDGLELDWEIGMGGEERFGPVVGSVPGVLESVQDKVLFGIEGGGEGVEFPEMLCRILCKA